MTTVKLFISLLCYIFTSNAIKVEYSQQYPLGSGPENLVVRPCGKVLTTANTDGAHIIEVDPVRDAVPKIIHTFEGTHGASGITYSDTPDVYHVVTGNYSFETFTPVPNSYAIHRLSFDLSGRPVSEEIGPLDLPGPGQSNGIWGVPESPEVLIADSYQGFIYKYNTLTRRQSLYFDHPLLKPASSGLKFGVNGVKLSKHDGNYLYFSNTNQEIIARIPATGHEKRLHGNPEIIAKNVPSDDFIVDERNGNVYMAEQLPINGLGFLDHSKYGTQPGTIYGGPNSTKLLGPTAVAFAKNGTFENSCNTLLVTMGGNFFQYVSGNYTGGAYLVMVHLSQ